MKIHKEGYQSLIVAVLVLGAINAVLFIWKPFPENLLWLIAGISVILFLLVLQFFRNPSRVLTLNDKLVVAPADGKVVVIEETNESEYFKTPRRQISIFMSPINVHINRNPIGGVVKYFKYHAGKYLVAWHPKSSTENERTTIVVETKDRQEVLFRQIAGAMAKRIVWYVEEGSEVKQGEEFGFIKFGSRVDILLPLDAEIKVNIGERTRGGETVIAELK